MHLQIDEKVQWASLSDEEEEEGQKQENKAKQAIKRAQPKKKAPAATKPTKTTVMLQTKRIA